MVSAPARTLTGLLRLLPIFLFCLLGGTVFIVLNDALYWDDWVWFFQAPSENLKIGRELGIWWAGHVSNAIYALPHPTLTLRVAALLAWAASAIAFALVLRRLTPWRGTPVAPLVLLYVAVSICQVRFLNSVAFYNIYIASYWIGAALYLCPRPGSMLRWLSLPFLFFGLYLNSMFAFHGLALAVLGWQLWRAQEAALGGARGYRAGDLIFNRDARQLWLGARLQTLRAALIAVLRQHGTLVAVPVLFIFLRRFTRQPSDFYRTYNDVETASLFKGMTSALSQIRQVFVDSARLLWNETPPKLLLVMLVLCGLLLLISRADKRMPALRTLGVQILIGLALVFVGIFPYLAVGKPPKVGDLYESRHLITAIPGFVIVVWAVIQALSRLFGQGWGGRAMRWSLLSLTLALFIGYSSVIAMELWRDRLLQMGLSNYIKAQRQRFADCRTLVFIDGTEGYRVSKRMIWNYEYTGYLIQLYGTKERIGIGAEEYRSWPPRVALLTEPSFRRRYNIDHLDFKACHAVIGVHNAQPAIRIGPVAEVALAHLRGEDIAPRIDKLFRFTLAFEKVEATERLAAIDAAVAFLMRHKAEHGHFPPSEERSPDRLARDGTPVRPLDELVTERSPGKPRALVNVVPGFAEYQAEQGRKPADLLLPLSVTGTFQYMSDGREFKLVFVDPIDIAYAKQNLPERLDPMRGAYGFWTEGAHNW